MGATVHSLDERTTAMNDALDGQSTLDGEYLAALKAAWLNDADDCSATVATLAAHASLWRSRANYYRGKCEAMAEALAYLKERVAALEAREDADEP
jgi:hypothetical protein